jgi:hypothetical protein
MMWYYVVDFFARLVDSIAALEFAIAVNAGEEVNRP